LNSSSLYIFYPDKQISSLNLPERKYCINITNLSVNIDAEVLSERFEWYICDIVMDTSVSNPASLTQCWLKNANNERVVDNFVQHWNGKVIGGSIIKCENKFQFGQCSKSSDECHWKHVPCTAKGTCSSACPYGHAFGMKSKHDSSNSKSNFQLIKYSIRIWKWVNMKHCVFVVRRCHNRYFLRIIVFRFDSD
jgi:hypothetical protein